MTFKDVFKGFWNFLLKSVVTHQKMEYIATLCNRNSKTKKEIKEESSEKKLLPLVL
jgi:hypothetical protein